LFAAFLETEFPQVRDLGDVSPGRGAALQEGAWTLFDLDYEEGDGPGEMPAPPPKDKRLEGWSHTCACCGETKTGLPELAFREPIAALGARGMPDAEIVAQDADLCRIRHKDEEHFFVRGLLPIALPDASDTYCFGVWSSISKENFKRYCATFEQDQRDLGVMFGYLNTRLPGLPDTADLPLNIVAGLPGQRPYFLLFKPDDPHPLYEAQQTGISIERLLEWIGPELSCDGSA
jgi:hypothetical protein